MSNHSIAPQQPPSSSAPRSHSSRRATRLVSNDFQWPLVLPSSHDRIRINSLTNHAKDLSADVTIWSCAEVATTIMAACIPVLRVLLQYIRSSAKEYSSDRYGHSGPASHVRGTRGTTTVVTASRNGLKSHAGKDDDAGSDRSILSGENATQIMQTSEYIVEFHDQGRAKANEDSDSMGGYEMTNRARVAETA